MWRKSFWNSCRLQSMESVSRDCRPLRILQNIEVNESKKPIQPKEAGFVVDFTNMFLPEHSELVQELRFKNEAEYRFYAELKRSAKAAEIAEDRTVGFVMGDCRFVFSDGEILALKDGKIVERKQLAEFMKAPARTYRQLQYAISLGEEMRA